MKQRILLAAIVLFGAIGLSTGYAAENSFAQTLETAYQHHSSHVQVEGEGTVIKLLPDDDAGIRHQRFLVKVAGGQTLLVAHNIDLAPRIEPLALGDHIGFSGEYVWNNKGGVIHWTHRDPQGRHVAGWIRHHGNLYQ